MFLALSLIVGIVLFATAIISLHPADLIKTLLAFHPYKVGLLLTAAALTHVISTVRWRHLLKFTGHTLPFLKSFGYYLTGFGISFITPIAQLGGRPAKAFLVSRTKDIPLRDSMVSVLLEIFLEFSVEILFIAIALPFLFFRFTFSESMEVSLGASFLLLTLIIIYLYRELRQGRKVISRFMTFLKIGKYFKNTANSKALTEGENIFVSYFRRRNSGGLAGIILSVGVFAGGMLEIAALFWLLDLPLSLPNVFIAKIFTNIAYLVPVPGALGVLEWLQAAYFSTILGLSSGVGVAFGILMKARDIFYTVIGLTVLLYIITHHTLKNGTLKDNLKRVFTADNNGL